LGERIKVIAPSPHPSPLGGEDKGDCPLIPPLSPWGRG